MIWAEKSLFAVFYLILFSVNLVKSDLETNNELTSYRQFQAITSIIPNFLLRQITDNEDDSLTSSFYFTVSNRNSSDNSGLNSSTPSSTNHANNLSNYDEQPMEITTLEDLTATNQATTSASNNDDNHTYLTDT